MKVSKLVAGLLIGCVLLAGPLATKAAAVKKKEKKLQKAKKKKKKKKYPNHNKPLTLENNWQK